MDAARETDVPPVKLQLASLTQSVEVSAEVQGVEVANAEVSNTVSMEQIQNLPILDRDVLGIMQTQAGVASNGNSTTVINGLRTSYSNMTLDGINIQDNYIRDNALDYTPNKLRVGQVRQMTLITSNPNAAAVRRRHRDGLLHAVRRQPVSRRGSSGTTATITSRPTTGSTTSPASGGRSSTRTSSAATSAGRSARTSCSSMRTTRRSARTSSCRRISPILTAAGAQRDLHVQRRRRAAPGQPAGPARLPASTPAMQALLAQTPRPDKINSTAVGDGRNYGGYRFNQRDNERWTTSPARSTTTSAPRHAISGTYAHNRDNSDRPDADERLRRRARGHQSDACRPGGGFLALDADRDHHQRSARRVQPDLRILQQRRRQCAVPYYPAPARFCSPIRSTSFRPQGRTTNTYNLSDDAAWQHGRHYVQFGFHGQHIGVRIVRPRRRDSHATASRWVRASRR